MKVWVVRPRGCAQARGLRRPMALPIPHRGGPTHARLTALGTSRRAAVGMRQRPASIGTHERAEGWAGAAANARLASA
eukprot:365765-Chlamydomonas_euryale.AAC.10